MSEIQPEEQPGRWTLIKDIIGFQFKLMVDGFRDFILVPVSMILGILCLLKPGDKPGTLFYSLLRTGRDTEHWINLFGAASRIEGKTPADKPLGDIDFLINKVEEFAVNEYKSGDLSRQAKDHFDQVVKTIRSRRN